MTVTKIFLILSLASVTFACSCYLPKLDVVFCHSVFIGVVKVVAGPEICDASLRYHCYNIEKIKTFKGDDLAVTQIKTIDNGPECGQRYLNDTEYLITSSSVENSFINTYLCDYRKVWSRMTDTEKNDIAAEFRTFKCGV